MPVEIRELQITVSVQDNGGSSNAPSSAPASSGSSEDMVAKCVEQVLEILKEKMER